MSNLMFLRAYVAVTTRIHDLKSRREQGAAAVEYGLLVGLIAVAIIAAVILLGKQLDVLFTKITTAITGAGVAVN